VSRLQQAIEQLAFARQYTSGLLDKTDAADWFRQPAGGVSHIGWQAGHLAYAEYRLALDRIRGPKPEDARLFPESYVDLFRRQSMPIAEAGRYPSAAELRALLDRIHAQVLRELPSLAEAEWDQPAHREHPLARTKLASVLWAGHHEMLHAGQIGLLRRQLGYAPVW
jgi:hypothetical protein